MGSGVLWYLSLVRTLALCARNQFTDSFLSNAHETTISDGKESACNVRDLGSIPGTGRSPREGYGNPLLGNSMDRGAWRTTVHEVTKSQTQLSDYTVTFTFLFSRNHHM